jgi:hypothetical protein
MPEHSTACIQDELSLLMHALRDCFDAKLSRIQPTPAYGTCQSSIDTFPLHGSYTWQDIIESCGQHYHDLVWMPLVKQLQAIADGVSMCSNL